MRERDPLTTCNTVVVSGTPQLGPEEGDQIWLVSFHCLTGPQHGGSNLLETCFSRRKCSQSKDLKHLPGSPGAEMRRQGMGRKRFLSEAGPAPQWQWLLLPVSSSSYQGTSCCCCHGDALFLRRQGKGDGEGKRTHLTATAPNCNNCPLQKQCTE